MSRTRQSRVVARWPSVAFLLLAVALSSLLPATAAADPLQVNWINYYYNESLAVAHLDEQPRMLRNISNSLMTSGPDFLEGSTYLQRRTSPWSGYEDVAELSRDWLRADRVSLSKPAVVVVAVREPFYPGAGALLTGLGWTALGETITLGYINDAAHLTLYAGLVDTGPVQISGAGVDLLFDAEVANTSWHHYFFFQETSAFAPDMLAQLGAVTVPEPSSLLLIASGAGLLLAIARRPRRA